VRLTNRVQAGSPEAGTLFAGIGRRAEAEDAGIMTLASDVLAGVRAGGWEAVRQYSRQFDAAEPYEITRDQIDAAYDRCGPALRDALERAARNIEDYQRRLLPKDYEGTSPDGAILGQLVRPLERAGVYVPGGTAAYPSTVLMAAIPAKVAGVDEVILVTPPGQLNDAVLAAAKIAGVDRAFAVGGIHAIGALAYGAGDIPAVDKIVGPGSAYVTAAKRLVFGTVGIDSIAGPSEILIIADETANPAWIAADLLSQAEHGVRAGLVFLTDSPALADAVETAIAEQLAALPRKDIARQALRDYCIIAVCRDLDECAGISNALAPEHLEVITAEPRALLPKLRNAGAVFLGPYTPESLGDYIAGPSHVLPTSGTARFFSPLNVEDFLKRTSVIEYGREAMLASIQDVAVMARSESLEAHAKAAEIRGADDV
jgi:histidinol dehydrogenase